MAVPNLKNRVGMSVSGTPGTGTITLGSAILDATNGDYVSCAAAYGADATADFLYVDGHKTSIERDVVYTHSGTTLTRGTVEATWDGSTLSTSALSLTSAAKVYVIATAERMRRGEMGYLEHSSHDGTADVTGVAGTMHVFTALTADRTFTLPAAAAVGDRIGITFPAGSASYEILLKSASGDKINNVDCSSTEWSRLFIAGETVIFRCIDGSTVDWIVEYDGRIPCSASVNGTVTSTSTNTNTYPDYGAATVVDNSSVVDVASDMFIARRTGRWQISAHMTFAASSAGKNTVLAAPSFISTYSAGSSVAGMSSSSSIIISEADTLQPYVQQGDSTSEVVTYRFNIVEIL